MQKVTAVSQPMSCMSGLGHERARNACSQDALDRKSAKLLRLRRLLARVEQRHGMMRMLEALDERLEAARKTPTRDCTSAWSLGCAEGDELLGKNGLARTAVHEIKPCLTEECDIAPRAWAASQAAALGFALALAARRLVTFSRSDPTLGSVSAIAPASSRQQIVLCLSTSLSRELGQLYGPGLGAFGFAPEQVLLVETARDQDCLWALEEVARSKTTALVIGALRDVALTPARRLDLAAREGASACLLLTHPRSPPVAATSTRWRIAPHPADGHPLHSKTPGARRFSASLEECRHRPMSAQIPPFALEWCHETLCFRLVSGISNRAFAPPGSQTPTRTWHNGISTSSGIAPWRPERIEGPGRVGTAA